MVLKHAGIMRACFKTIGKVSRPCTRSQQRFPTLSTVGVLNYVIKVLHFKTFLATPACTNSLAGPSWSTCGIGRGRLWLCFGVKPLVPF